MPTDQKILNELEKLLTDDRISRIDSVLENRTSSLTIVLENVEHTHNISAVIRTADAFGISEIYILNEGKLLNNSQLSGGISLGSEKWVNIQMYSSKEELVTKLKSEGFKLVALLRPELKQIHQSEDLPQASSSNVSIPVSTLPFEDKLALLFGNEVNGISDFLKQAADFHAYIPMFGFVESFNISVACAITLYSSTIEKSLPKKRTAGLTVTEKNTLREDWIKKSVQNVDVVLRSLSKKILDEKL